MPTLEKGHVQCGLRELPDGKEAMNRAVVVTGFAVAALTLLAVQIVNRFGYSSTKGIVILGVVGVLALFTVGINSLVAIVVALVLYYGLDYSTADKLTTAVLLAAIAVIASLAVQGKSAWRR
jgi:hypothetical protein